MKLKPIKNQSVIIDGLMTQIDFYRIEKTMSVLDWRWGDEVNTPTRIELEEKAIELLERVLGGECTEVNTGGFLAWRTSDDDFGIIFILEEATS